MPKNISDKDFQKIIDRAGDVCEYCKCPRSYCPDPFTVDHVIPSSLHGIHAFSNWALACFGCNNLKYNFISGFDVVTQTISALYNPRLEKWSKHFEWSQDLLEIIGKTPSGRATVEKLQLNRLGVINLRRLLKLAKKHPPPTK